MTFFVYILKCRDNSLYTGVSIDVKKRMEVHAKGKGSKYVKTRRPFRLVHLEEYETKSQALKREYEIKQMPRYEKLAILNCR